MSSPENQNIVNDLRRSWRALVHRPQSRDNPTANGSRRRRPETIVDPVPKLPDQPLGSETYEQIRLAFMLEEFKQIKQENLVSISSMQSTLSFGLTGMSLLIAALTQIYRQSSTVTGVILLVLAPAIFVLITRVWSAEVMRLGRASYFLSLLETEINAYFAMRGVPDVESTSTFVRFSDALHWETWVRGGNQGGRSKLMRRNYQFILWFMIGGASASLALGAGVLWFDRAPSLNLVVRLIILGAALAGVILLAFEGRTIWRAMMSSVQGGDAR